MERLKRIKNENSIRVLFLKIILFFAGYIGAVRIYTLIKGLLNFAQYGTINILIDLVIICIVIFLGWWLWDYNGIFENK